TTRRCSARRQLGEPAPSPALSRWALVQIRTPGRPESRRGDWNAHCRHISWRCIMGRTASKAERDVTIPSGSRTLRGILSEPPEARGVVAFAHGSGSGRFSPRNQFVARTLQQAGLATLLLDLLEEEEAEEREKVFDIELLASRLHSAADWLRQQPSTAQ